MCKLIITIKIIALNHKIGSILKSHAIVWYGDEIDKIISPDN